MHLKSEADTSPALLTILVSRKMGCKLPFMIYTPSSFPRLNATLKNIKGISTKSGFNSHLDSLLDNNFKEVMLIEPGTLFFYNPELLFSENGGYQETGALFWKVHKKSQVGDFKIWRFMQTLIPYKKSDNYILNKETSKFQAPLLILDKSNHSVTLQKLATLLDHKQLVEGYLNTWEFYWLAAEFAKEEYTFVESIPGNLGEYDVFFASDTSPCWFNPVSGEIPDVKEYSIGVHFTQQNPVEYFKHTLVSQNLKLDLDKKKLSKEQLNLLNEFRKIYNEVQIMMVNTK